VLRVQAGEVRVQRAGTETSVDPRAGSVRLGGVGERLEAGALVAFELAWRGQASARLSGPLLVTLQDDPGVAFLRFQSADVEVRRGTLRLAFAGHGTLWLGPGALVARTLPAGLLELENRGAGTLEIRRGRERPLTIAPGAVLRLKPLEERP